MGFSLTSAVVHSVHRRFRFDRVGEFALFRVGEHRWPPSIVIPAWRTTNEYKEDGPGQVRNAHEDDVKSARARSNRVSTLNTNRGTARTCVLYTECVKSVDRARRVFTVQLRGGGNYIVMRGRKKTQFVYIKRKDYTRTACVTKKKY